MELPKEIQSIFIYEGADLVSFGLLPPYHLTFHSGPNSGIADIHIKNESKSKDENRYVTLIEVPHNQLDKLNGKVTERVIELYKQAFQTKRINLGKLERYRCILIHLNSDLGKEHFIEQKKKRTARIKKEIDDSIMDSLILLPNEIEIEEAAATYLVLKESNGNLNLEGMIISPYQSLSRRPFFIQQKDLRKFMIGFICILIDTCKELDIKIHPEVLSLFENIKNGHAVNFDKLLAYVS